MGLFSGEIILPAARRTPLSAIGAALLLLGLLLMGLGGCTGREPARSESNSPAANSTPETLSPNFTMTRSEFEQLTGGLPDSYRQSIEDRPTAFLNLLAELAREPPELLRLVDKGHPLPADYEPADLVDLDDIADRLDLSRSGHRLRAIVLPDLLAMTEAARSDGITLLVSSAYRSYEYQDKTYRYWVDQLGQEEADRVSARAGTSQHQLGTAIDFGCICDAFGESDAGRWMVANARRFGFSLSYPAGYEAVTGYAHESWHYRYLGRVATQMEIEFFSGIQQYLIEFLDGPGRTFFTFLIEI